MQDEDVQKLFSKRMNADAQSNITIHPDFSLDVTINESEARVWITTQSLDMTDYLGSVQHTVGLFASKKKMKLMHEYWDHKHDLVSDYFENSKQYFQESEVLTKNFNELASLLQENYTLV